MRLALAGAVGIWYHPSSTQGECSSGVFGGNRLRRVCVSLHPAQTEKLYEYTSWAVPGAIPPMIGWAAVAHVEGGSWMDGRSWYLFALLFLWQMPHFVAISWMCRVEYEEAGYCMWSNGDVSGKKTGWIAIFFTVLLILLSPLGWLLGYANLVWAIGGAIVALVMLWLSWKFLKIGEKPAATRLFLYTLLHLPLALALLAIGWHQG